MTQHPSSFNVVLGAHLIVTTVAFGCLSFIAYENTGAARYASTIRQMIDLLGVHILVWFCFALSLLVCAVFFGQFFGRKAPVAPVKVHEDTVRTGTISNTRYAKIRDREIAILKINSPEGNLRATVSSPVAISLLKLGSTGKKVWVRGTFAPTAGPHIPHSLSVHHLKIL